MSLTDGASSNNAWREVRPPPSCTDRARIWSCIGSMLERMEPAVDRLVAHVELNLDGEFVEPGPTVVREGSFAELLEETHEEHGAEHGDEHGDEHSEEHDEHGEGEE